ncbi:MAG: tetratricopeptide repeat protein [Candidatus Zambryskibacteria bacterium]|nr:tetratricopeptide repeat protein [Candidatus Zambryskibacteria bacterium]
MSQSYKNSFYIILALLFISPLFFIPGTAFSLEVAKSSLFSLGIIVAALVFIFETWKKGSLSFPKSSLFYVLALLPAIYLLSALLSTPSSISLVGYNLEVGTFGFMLLGVVLFVLSMVVFSNKTEKNLGDNSRVLQAMVALFITLSILVLFVVFRIFTGGDVLALGNFFGNMGNPLGSWTDLAVVFGLLSVLTALAIGMIPVKFSIKAFLYAVFVVSTTLLVVINFSTAFALTLVASVFLFFYFSKVENHYHTKGETGEKGGEVGKGKGFFAQATLLPIVLGLISITFLVNPAVPGSADRLSDLVANISNVSNADVRPTLAATLSISKAVLSQVALLGSGPNTFSHDWLIFKPLNVNTTPFWGIAFPHGVGFIPTQIATTGILGTALWAAFLVLLVVFSFKVLSHIPDLRVLRFTLISSLIVTLFLWAASLIYTPSITVLMLAFIFTGILLALSEEVGVVSSRAITLKESQSSSLGTIFVMLALTAGTLCLGWIAVEKTIASYHFQKAVNLSNTADVSLLPDVEAQLDKAVKFAPLDTYYVAISRLNFYKAKQAGNSTTGTPEERQALFQDALSRSVAAAKSAIAINPAGYENWVVMGSLYSALVPEPLKVAGAYDNARFAYSEALKRNPNNPQLPLFLAQLELNNGDADAARSYIRNSIALKEDYAEAYLALAQLEIQQKNIPAAIASTEALVQLLPNNAGVHFELGVLRYSSGDYQSAGVALSAAIALMPDYANAKYYLALTLAKLGKNDEAKTIISELIVANPDNADLKSALQELSKKK